MVSIRCAFVACIHSSRTWMSGSFESVRWNACVHRLDFALNSYPKELWGMQSESMSTPRAKSPLPEVPREEEGGGRGVEPAMLHHAE